MPCTSFSKALIVLGVSWSMSKLESLSSLLELLVSLSESTAACSFLVKVVLVVLSLSEVVCLRLVIVEGLVLVVVGLVLVVVVVVVVEEGGRDGDGEG